MSSLILDSLEIRQFRAFRHLQVEHLGRVNLVVGKNNVGKTCLLEALWLYVRQGDPVLIWKLLKNRGEDRESMERRHSGLRTQNWVPTIRYLFYGRKSITESLEPIQIGPVNSPDKLSIALTWFTERIDEQIDGPLEKLAQYKKYNLIENPIPALVIQMGVQPRISYRLDRDIHDTWPPSGIIKDIPCIFISAGGLDEEEVLQFWDDIALTKLEEDIISAMRLIAPEVERINLISNKDYGGGRIPMVKVATSDKPIPLRSLGEGMHRLFSLVLALVNAENGLLLIDEVESGLHYAIQPDLWRLIFEAARRLNVQVFATTHSWDCIKAFQQAADENKEDEGLLISLRRKKGQREEIVAVLIDEEKLNIVAREQIEVR
jgi:hypothetical protein